jgi:hypothetical protein
MELYKTNSTVGIVGNIAPVNVVASAATPPVSEIDTENQGEMDVSNITTSSNGANESTAISGCSLPLSNTHEAELVSKRKGGRRKGDTIRNKRSRTEKLKQAVTEAATLCLEARADAKKKNKKLTKGTFKQLIKDTEEKYSLEDNSKKFQDS